MSQGWWKLDPITAMLIEQDQDAAEVAADLAYDGTLNQAQAEDIAALAVMRKPDTVLDVEQVISMGLWHESEKFMMWLYDMGLEW